MKTIGIFLICFVYWGLSFSQKFSYKEYTVYDGLSQMQTTCLFQDSRGYLWIGTKGGLSKFNGETFESYQSYVTLPGTYVTDIEEDREGNIWVAFRKDGVARFDGKGFVHFALGEEVEGSKLEIDDSNRIMVFNYLGGVKCFDGEKFTDIQTLLPATKPIGEIDFGTFDETYQRMLFYNETTGLWALKNGDLKPLKGEIGTFKNFCWIVGVKLRFL